MKVCFIAERKKEERGEYLQPHLSTVAMEPATVSTGHCVTVLPLHMALLLSAPQSNWTKQNSDWGNSGNSYSLIRNQ